MALSAHHSSKGRICVAHTWAVPSPASHWLAWHVLMLIPAFLHSLDLTGERPSRAWKAFVTRAGIWAGCWAALRLGLSLQHPNVRQKRSFEYESEQLLEAALQWGKYKDKEGGVK